MLPNDVVVFDVETTGLSHRNNDRIIELGALHLNGAEEQDRFHTLIKVNHPINRHAQRVHGITQRMLVDQPESDEVFSEFHTFIGSTTLVAHNASFDMGFLQAEFSRLGLGLNNRVECTMKQSRRLLPSLPNHTLGTVYQHLGGKMTKDIVAHRALGDARMAAFVWGRLLEMEE